MLGTPVPEVDVAAMDDLYTGGLVATMCMQPGTPLSGRDPNKVMGALKGQGPERIFDLYVRLGPWGDGLGANPGGLTLDDVRAHPDGLRLGEIEGGRLDAAVSTPSGAIELIHGTFVDDVPRLRARLERSDEGLLLTSRRHLRSNNSWLHNVQSLMRGRDRCTLLIHPDDAARIGLSTGEVAEVSTSEGKVSVPVEVSDEMMPAWCHCHTAGATAFPVPNSTSPMPTPGSIRICSTHPISSMSRATLRWSTAFRARFAPSSDSPVSA